MDFSPSLLAIQESPPARYPLAIHYIVCTLFVCLSLWAFFGNLDIVASADGKLVPLTYVKIVQPADNGVVRDILVKEGEHVLKGQVLLRMDSENDRADEITLKTELGLRSLQLRRIDAEMNRKPLSRDFSDPNGLFSQVEFQLQERRRAYNDTLEQAAETLKKTRHDFESGNETLLKLKQVAPILEQQANAYESMGQSGFVSQIQVRDKKREFLEKAQDLKAQMANQASLASGIASAEKQVAQITSKYRSDLQNERVDAEVQFRKIEQELAKKNYKMSLLEMKSPQNGVIKDLAIHTAGTVVTPGTVLASIVPDNDPLIAEIMIKNDDIGFVYPHQKVKIKLASFPFQQYGMLDGEIISVAADATGDGDSQSRKNDNNTPSDTKTIYKAIVSLAQQGIRVDNVSHELVPGMQVIAEIDEGKRSIIRYLLSPLQKTANESGRER